jgi:hypothetical protein
MSHPATQCDSITASGDENGPAILFLHDHDFVINADAHAEQSLLQQASSPEQNDFHLFPLAGKSQGEGQTSSSSFFLRSTTTLHNSSLLFQRIARQKLPSATSRSTNNNLNILQINEENPFS